MSLYVKSVINALIKGVFIALLFSGCGDSAGSLDRSEEQHPLLRKAKAKLASQDTEAAIKLYYEVLDSNPTLARAHLELGLVFDEHKEDYIRSIYHYQRYLELRPNTEKSQLIEDAMRHARLAYAASLPNRPSDAIKEIASLQDEVANLQRRNRDMLVELERLKGRDVARIEPDAEVAVQKVDEPAPPPPKKNDEPRFYVVKSGDTLTKISKRVYGSSNHYLKLYQANRKIMKSPQDLKIGQKLTIPEL